MNDSQLFQDIEKLMDKNGLPLLEVIYYNRSERQGLNVGVVTSRQSLEKFVEKDGQKKSEERIISRLSPRVSDLKISQGNGLSVIGDFMIANIVENRYNLSIYAG